jgi:hypothetical protein
LVEGFLDVNGNREPHSGQVQRQNISVGSSWYNEVKKATGKMVLMIRDEALEAVRRRASIWGYLHVIKGYGT